MRKIAVLLFVMVIAFAFAGCGSEAETADIAAGTWIDPNLEGYYLSADQGEFVIVNSEGEQLGAGTYTTEENNVTFTMDGNTFEAVIDGDEMIFDMDGQSCIYKRQ